MGGGAQAGRWRRVERGGGAPESGRGLPGRSRGLRSGVGGGEGAKRSGRAGGTEIDGGRRCRWHGQGTSVPPATNQPHAPCAATPAETRAARSVPQRRREEGLALAAQEEPAPAREPVDHQSRHHASPTRRITSGSVAGAAVHGVGCHLPAESGGLAHGLTTGDSSEGTCHVAPHSEQTTLATEPLEPPKPLIAVPQQGHRP